jgi:hypothetical protein
MTTFALKETATVIRELALAADAFAVRAREQEACRDRARPGTAVQHRHAHSATLWRLAEQSLRTRVEELEAGSGGATGRGARTVLRDAAAGR